MKRVAPILEGVTPLPSLKKKFKITVPANKKGGDTTFFAVQGERVTVRIPRNCNAGDKFTYIHSQKRKVYSSTLPTIPGMEIVQSKPVIWATASHAFCSAIFNDTKEQNKMAKGIGSLLMNAQNQLLEKTIEVDCNASWE